ncbi:ankyrin repeat domain-containing protein [Singulisphaera sp. Ch08]|uniref:Ankyrin repeat domain-containing protein n=1 Tax=Singulisphaera sp. Ch08 TaxID=3120278 RepID=A0AAU7C954_9BACT
MDFGGFILFALLAVGLLVGSLLLVAAFFTRSPRRWHGLGLWLGGVMLLVVFGRHLYQAYWLDESLYMAAARGDTAQVEILLSAGASPNATWEDGNSALSSARSHGHKAVVIILEHAGATQ